MNMNINKDEQLNSSLLRCQSCSIPLKIKEIIGTCSQGKPYKTYCIMCYKNGVFTEPDITLSEMIDKVVSIICKHSKVDPESMKTIVEKEISSLDRWVK